MYRVIWPCARAESRASYFTSSSPIWCSRAHPLDLADAASCLSSAALPRTRWPHSAKKLVLTLADGTEVGLARAEQLVGFTMVGGVDGEGSALASVLLCHNDLHCEIKIDPTDPIGATHPAGVCDIILESGALLRLRLRRGNEKQTETERERETGTGKGKGKGKDLALLLPLLRWRW